MKRNDRLIQTKTASLMNAIITLSFLIASTIRCDLVALALTENVAVLLKRRAHELGLLPQVGSEEAVGVGDGDEGGLQGVLKGLGRAGGGGVNVADTCELEQTLDGWRGDETGTAWSWDELCNVSRCILVFARWR